MLFIKIAHSFLKGLLTHPKGRVDFICRTFIIQCNPSAIILDVLQQGFRKIVYLLETGFLEYQVYLAIFAYLLDKSFHPVARVQGLEYLTIIEQTAVLIFNDCLET